MSLESCKFRGEANGTFPTSIDHSVLHILRIHLDLALDAEQDGVVHDVETGEEVAILLDHTIHFLDVLPGHVHLLNVVLVSDEVLILQCRCVRCTSLDTAIEHATLQVVYPRDVVFIVEAKSVPHKDQVHLLVVFHLDRVDTVDA